MTAKIPPLVLKPYRLLGMRSSLLAASLALVTMAGCGGGSDTPAPTEPAKVYRHQDQTLTVDPRARTYTLVLPPNYFDAGTGNVPLVIAMHGGGGSAAQFESTSLLTTKANASNFAVVYPNGTSDGGLGLNTWNAGSCCGSAVSNQVNDVNFIRQLINELASRYRINTQRIYATGHSNGGMMSHRLACELSDRIAAVAPNAAALVVTCNASRPVPVLMMHSKLDRNVPLQGGVGVGLSGVPYPPMTTATQRWTGLNACASPSNTTTVSAAWSREVWSGCAGNANVELLLTEDGGHSWPGGLPGSANGDPTSKVINANDELWAFFGRYALP
jgi:polyhydroxybutyrate depolymerase